MSNLLRLQEIQEWQQCKHVLGKWAAIGSAKRKKLLLLHYNGKIPVRQRKKNRPTQFNKKLTSINNKWNNGIYKQKINALKQARSWVKMLPETFVVCLQIL